jgi:hypothetical protein
MQHATLLVPSRSVSGSPSNNELPSAPQSLGSDSRVLCTPGRFLFLPALQRSVPANGVRAGASVTAAIGLRGCLHLLRRAEMMTALVFRFLLSLRWTGHAVAQKSAGAFGEKSNMRRKL